MQLASHAELARVAIMRLARRGDQPDRCFIHPRRGFEERRQKRQIARAGDGARQLGPNQLVQRWQVVTGNFGKQVMLQVVILVQQEERDHRTRQHGPAGEVGIGGFRDAVLGETADGRERAHREQRHDPDHEQVTIGKHPEEHAVDRGEQRVPMQMSFRCAGDPYFQRHDGNEARYSNGPKVSRTKWRHHTTGRLRE